MTGGRLTCAVGGGGKGVGPTQNQKGPGEVRGDSPRCSQWAWGLFWLVCKGGPLNLPWALDNHSKG